jgi:putative membrane protein
MSEIIEDKTLTKVGDPRVHMANERTFLAWIRTSIGIMAFGFVVEKFAFFLKQMSIIMGNSTTGISSPPSQNYPAFIGIFLVCLGMVLVLLAFIRYKKVQSQIDSDTFQPSSILNVIITVSILAAGVFLVIYLIQSI